MLSVRAFCKCYLLTEPSLLKWLKRAADEQAIENSVRAARLIGAPARPRPARGPSRRRPRPGRRRTGGRPALARWERASSAGSHPLRAGLLWNALRASHECAAYA